MDSKKKLSDILKKIEENNLVLPDFQREYVWIKDNKVNSFIASVLAQIPLGNIITFRQKCNTFANKELGFKTSINFENETKDVEFLLDGQQRITTLSLFFSDRIFNKISNGTHKVSDLITKKALQRAFLKLPLYTTTENVTDIFGFLNFNFPFENNTCTLCSNDFEDVIEILPFNFGKKDKWYRYYTKDELSGKESNEFVKKCVENGYIPLYYILDQERTLCRIINELAESRKTFLLLDQFPKNKCNELIEFIKENENLRKVIDLNQGKDRIYEAFKREIEQSANLWSNLMFQYLKSCLDLSLLEITINNEGAHRAINVYESLNKGGSRLTTFDLIVAKAANNPRSDGKTYYQFVDEIYDSYYNEKLGNCLQVVNDKWNVREYLCNSNETFNPIFIKQFLNLLCIVANFYDENGNQIKDFDLKTEYCKEKKQLNLTANQITTHTGEVAKALCDALLIAQYKFGIIEIGRIQYNLMILPIAYACYLMNVKKFNGIDINKTIAKIVSWYWYSLFAGEYKYDQSEVVIKHIKDFHEWIINGTMPKYISIAKANAGTKILEIEDYNNFNVLSMQTDTVIKNAVKESLCQFVLSQTPEDFVKGTDGMFKILNSWSRIKFDIHHVIPLATATSVGQSSKDLRKQSDHILNSPLNMVYISQEANKVISSRNISSYRKELPDTFKTYQFPKTIETYQYDEQRKDELIQIYKDRFDSLKSNIISVIKTNIDKS